jgi:DNA-binding transcriptional MerR regulator
MTPSLGPKAVADATGVSTDTLRHYERMGLLPNVDRTAAGYRRYSQAAVQRVLLIRRALLIGFSLDDLKRVLAVRDRGGTPCRNVRKLVGQRLDALERRIDDLSRLRDDLRLLTKEWDRVLATTPAGERAHLLETLGQSQVIEKARKAGDLSISCPRRLSTRARGRD